MIFLFDDAFRDIDDEVASWGIKIYNETELISAEGDINIAGRSLSIDLSHIGVLWTLGK